MQPPEKDPNDNGHHDSPSPRTMLLVILVLLVGGYFVCMKLIEMSLIQDCAMSGRHNCAPLTDITGRPQ
jgi:hypothetical protein